jgi:hypothetical protein
MLKKVVEHCHSERSEESLKPSVSTARFLSRDCGIGMTRH